MSSPDEFPDGTPWWARLVIVEWREAWRWFSTWLIAATAAAPAAYESLPQLQELLEPSVFHWAQAILGGLVLAAHFRRKPEG